MTKSLGRRNILVGMGGSAGLAALGIGGVLTKGAWAEQAAGKAAMPATPACGADHELTPASAEGPFYTPRTPMKTNLLESDRGDATVMRLTGRVLDTNCRPIAGAVLDYWHVDQNARYDNKGYRYRGHQFTDADGLYRLDSLHPVTYRGWGVWRTAHLHVKVQGPGTRLLTTQLYFPREAVNNARDGGYRPELETRPAKSEEPDVVALMFDFVLERNTA